MKGPDSNGSLHPFATFAPRWTSTHCKPRCPRRAATRCFAARTTDGYEQYVGKRRLADQLASFHTAFQPKRTFRVASIKLLCSSPLIYLGEGTLHCATSPAARRLADDNADARMGDARAASAARTDDDRTPRSPPRKTSPSKISYCGICHTDLHFAHDDWGMSQYPMCQGTRSSAPSPKSVRSCDALQAGRQGREVCCLVDSCRTCEFCWFGHEQFCVEMPTFTYSAPDRQTGEITQGGYSQSIVVREEFVCRIPDELDFAQRAFAVRRHHDPFSI